MMMLFAADAADAGTEITTSPAVIAALIGAMVLGCITFGVAGRLEPRFVGAFGLLAALSAGFGLFAALIPSGNEWVGLAVFVVTFAFFRLLSRFESIGS
jgi:hypothetical protein